MGKSSSHKRQHFVPKSYLSAWTDPSSPAGQTPYVWIFSKSGGDGKRKAPENIFTETDMYTVRSSDGVRDLRFEQGLSQLETGITSTRRDFLESRKQPPLVRYLKLLAFLSAMRSRTPSFRDHHRKQWSEILKVGEDLVDSMANKTPEERRRAASMHLPSSKEGGSFTMDDIKKLAEHPIQTLLPRALEAELSILPHMQMTVLCTDKTNGFITSDNPVTWFDPEAHKRPLMFRSPGLLTRTLEITMPISPSQLLLIHHADPPARGIKPINFVSIESAVVLEANRRARAYASEDVIVSNNHFDPEWLAYA